MTSPLDVPRGLTVVSKSLGEGERGLEFHAYPTGTEYTREQVQVLHAKLGEWLRHTQTRATVAALRTVVRLQIEADHRVLRTFFSWLETAGVPYEPTPGGVLLLNPNDAKRVGEWLQANTEG